MADNTNLNSMTGGDIISTDVITTLNGAGIATGEKAQRVKVGWGADATFNDTTAANPLPVVQTGTPALPTGAATAAKQPALGTAGTASADVLTVQGKASMTPLLVDGSAVTQPVSASALPLPSGAATAANQTTMDGHLTDGTQQAKLTDGTNTVNILKSDGTAAGQNAALIAGTRLEAAFTTTTVQPLIATDVSNYGFVSVQVNTQGTTSTVTFQSSNDNATWVSTSLLTTAGNGGAAVSTTTAGMWYGPLTGRYFRLNVTGISAGTTAGTVEFFNSPKAMHSANITAVQSGTWTVGLSALTTGGFTPGHIVSAATTNAAVIKASAGTLSSSSAFNISGSPRYVHFYNKATTPTVGTDVPVQTYGIPGNTSGSGYTLPLPPQGLVFAAGISYSITSGMADTDATAIGAGDVVLNWGSI